MGDLNVAASAADRSSGKLERYDEGTNSLVIALRRLGLTDCHEAAGPSAMGFTFCPKGRGVSRIDYVYGPMGRRWDGRRLGNLRGRQWRPGRAPSVRIMYRWSRG